MHSKLLFLNVHSDIPLLLLYIITNIKIIKAVQIPIVEIDSSLFRSSDRII